MASRQAVLGIDRGGFHYGVTKVFEDVSFQLDDARTALVGENGSGKSTLIRCLAGYQPPDPGARIEAGGRPLPVPYSTKIAHEEGLRFVHQDLGLVPNLTVAENLAIGFGFLVAALGVFSKWR